MAQKIYTRDHAAPLELRQAGEEQGVVTLRGYASVFDVWTDLYKSDTRVVREVIRKGAFARDIQSGSDVKALFDHDPGQVLGRVGNGTLRLKEDDVGLAVEIDLPDTTLGRDVAELVRRGDLSGMSFAFVARPGGEKSVTRTEGNATVVENEITSVVIYEVSVVLWPAYPTTSVDIVSRSEINHAEQAVDEVRGEAAAADSREEEGPSGLEDRYRTLQGYAQEILSR